MRKKGESSIGNEERTRKEINAKSTLSEVQACGKLAHNLGTA